MPPFEVDFAVPADEDIAEAQNYIRNILESPMAAANLAKALIETVQLLKENPHRRPLVDNPYLAALGVYSIPIKKYRAFYQIDEEKHKVYILRFLHSKRDWINILKSDMKDEK
jgi:plasmid stabilization system protein ParE